MADTPDVGQVFPLTPLQQGLLLHSIAQPELGVYVNQSVIELSGPLRPARLRNAWARAAARHSALRAAFVWQGVDVPLQVIRPAVSLPWTEHDWRGRGAAGPERDLSALLAADRARPFEFTSAPLMRLVLIRVAADRWWLVWTYHHLLLDGWAATLVVDEVLRNYREAPDGALQAGPQIADYVAWLHRQPAQAAERHWRNRLAGLAEPTPLPAGRLTAAGPPAFTEVTETMDAAATAELISMCRQRRLTVATVLHGAWALLLSRYTGRDDVVFGSMVSGRPPTLPGAHDVVGLLSNTIPVRVRLDGEKGMAGWLAELQAELARDREYEHAPLARVQRCSGLPAGTGLFETLIAIENYPVRPGWTEQDGGIAVTRLWAHERPHYPLAVVASQGRELTLRCLIDRAWFDEGIPAQLLAHLRALLAAAAREPDRKLAEVAVLTSAESARLVHEWPPGDNAAAPWPSLAAGLAAQAGATPDAIAVAWQGGEWTYREFLARVAGAGQLLRSMGVGPDVPVAVCCSPSPELLVSLWAVQWAGGFAVPMNPGYPAERVAMLAGISGARILLSTAADRAALPPLDGIRVLCPDLRAAAPTPPPEDVGPDNLAYVIHTSGSTGVPKGVMSTQRAVLNQVTWIQRSYPIGPADRVAQLTSVSFDMSVWEIYWAPLAGACVLVPRASAREPERLAAELSGLGVTVAAYVPSVLTAILADPAQRLPSGLRLVIVAGEALQPSLLARLRDCYTGAAMNGYGPTETTVVSVAWPLPAGAGPRQRVLIGRPVSNASCYVLDRELRPVPVGVAGELYVGGQVLARGYLRQPGLTAERFVPDLFGRPGRRLYRTGDLARWTAGGELEYLGRCDNQVKVRGFRVEPGEIEAVLSGHPSVRQAVVLARDDNGTGAQLVAYLVAGGAEAQVSELRGFLAGRLPDYLVPSVFLWLPELPLGTTGKVDRGRLPRPDGVRPDVPSAFVAPRSPAELTLAEIWSDVLRIDRVGVDDNFFELGGDSILSLLVVSKAAKAGLRVLPRHFFEFGTFGELAAAAEPVEQQVAVAAASEPGPVPLTPAQLWFFAQHFHRPGHWNLGHFFAIDPLMGELTDVAAVLGSALAVVIRAHQALCTRFAATPDGTWQAVVCPPDELALDDLVRIVPLAEDAGWPAALAGALGPAQEFDLSRPPLLRAVIIDGGRPDRWRLLLTAHHLVVDGVSWRILIEDLRAAYRDAAAGRAIQLPESGTTPGAWAGALQRLAATERFAGDFGYWQALPGSQAPGAGRPLVRDVRQAVVTLDAERTRLLLTQVPKAYRTRMDDVLLTAVMLALADTTGTRTLLVALEGHGREQHVVEGADLSRTVGWLTSIAPARLALPEGTDLPGALKAVKEQLRELADGGLSYGVLRYLDAERGQVLAALAGPQVSFNYLGQLDAPVSGEARQPPGLPGPPGPGELRLTAAPEPGPVSYHPDSERPHALEITGIITGGELRLTFAAHRLGWQAGELASATLARLRALIEHCTGSGNWGVTPSDFPESGLSQDQLDSLLDDLSRARHPAARPPSPA